MIKTAIFLWRFQPFHIGHYSIVEKILTEYKRLMLVIGSAEKSGTDENPWTLQEREEIIRASIPLELQERMDIVWLDDVPDDDIWCENLKALTSPVIARNEMTTRSREWIASPSTSSGSQWQGITSLTLITGNEWVRDICARHGIQTEWIDSYEIDISGTRIREMIQRGEDVSNFTFL